MSYTQFLLIFAEAHLKIFLLEVMHLSDQGQNDLILVFAATSVKSLHKKGKHVGGRHGRRHAYLQNHIIPTDNNNEHITLYWPILNFKQVANNQPKLAFLKHCMVSRVLHTYQALTRANTSKSSYLKLLANDKRLFLINRSLKSR